MKQKNTTTTAERKKLYANDYLCDLAMRGTISTLKRILIATDDVKIRQMYFGLLEDSKKINNDFFSVADKNGYTVTDGYDCFIECYCYLKERINKYTAEAEAEAEAIETIIQMIAFEVIEKKLMKNGTEKERTVFQNACGAVRKYIYRNGQTDFKRVYIEDIKKADEDGNTETEAEAVDRIYLKAGRYYDIQNLTDYETYNEALKNFKQLTDRQQTIIHYRLQGFSVSAIAKKLNVSQQSISKQLATVQNIIKEKQPEAVRSFKEKRIKKEA